MYHRATRHASYREVPDDGSVISSDDETAQAAARNRQARGLRRRSNFPVSPSESEDERYKY